MRETVRSVKGRGKCASRKAKAGLAVARAVGVGARPEMLERRVMLSAAIAAFGAPQSNGSVPPGVSVTSATVADLNHDGKPDLILGNIFGTSVGVMLGNG